MSLDRLAEQATRLGAPLDEAQLSTFELYRQELLIWNQRFNLTSITDPIEVEVRHFIDSLWCLVGARPVLAARPSAALVDVGSGAGFPGLPLKIARPALQVTLIESVGKKVAFLEHLIRRLGLSGVRVVQGRAEDLAQTREHREHYNLAVARAVAPLPVLLELCLPLVQPGGRLIAPRKGDLVAQQREATRAAEELRGAFRAPISMDLGLEQSDYGLVLVDKTGWTPGKYPRRAGTPARKPL